MDFDSYAAHFGLTPERQAEVDRRMGEDLERIAAKQAEIEPKRVAEEFDRLEKSKVTLALLKGTTAKLQEHRLSQQSERVECQVLRVPLE